MVIYQVIANVLNIWNLVVREEYNIGSFALIVTILHSLTKNNILYPWCD